MTAKECRDYILRKYNVGQTINIRYRGKAADGKTNIKVRKKVEILKFYPGFVLCLVEGIKESYKYIEMIQLTTYNNKE